MSARLIRKLWKKFGDVACGIYMIKSKYVILQNILDYPIQLWEPSTVPMERYRKWMERHFLPCKDVFFNANRLPNPVMRSKLGHHAKIEDGKKELKIQFLAWSEPSMINEGTNTNYCSTNIFFTMFLEYECWGCSFGQPYFFKRKLHYVPYGSYAWIQLFKYFNGN